MRTYTAKTLIETYRWAKAHPAGIIPIDRCERLTGDEWIAWFRKRLDEKTNRGLVGTGRKWDGIWYLEMERAARAVNTPRLRVTWVPLELRERLAHRIVNRDDY